MSGENEKEEESLIYKQLSEEMRNGLRNIYYQISSASAETCEFQRETGALITEASNQLEEVVRATESAAMNIMRILENRFEAAGESGDLLRALKAKMPEDKTIDKLIEINEELVANLTDMLTALSFQDITGQRIKKVSMALKAIERSVLDLYLSSGLVMNAARENPGGDAEQIQAEAQKAVEEYREKNTGSTLKGPDANAPSQDAIDSMLAQLGL